MKDIDVYGIGNAIVDLQVSVGDDLLKKLELVKGTMGLVSLEKQRELRAAVSAPTSKSSGGSLANSIITLAQLGSKTAFSCAVGKDEDGKFYAEELVSLGVVADVKFRNGSQTGTSAVMITPDAERTMSTYLGASASFTTDDLNKSLVDRSKWIFIEGYLLDTDGARQAAFAAAEYARSVGTKVAFTCSNVFLIEFYRDAVENMIKLSDLTFANLAETRALFKSAPDEEPTKLFEKLVAFCSGDCVMTMSDKGATISLGGQTAVVPGEKVHAVDATGAGDIFAGTFLYGMLSGRTPEECGRLACRLAGKVVSKLGARLTGDLIETF